MGGAGQGWLLGAAQVLWVDPDPAVSSDSWASRWLEPGGPLATGFGVFLRQGGPSLSQGGGGVERPSSSLQTPAQLSGELAEPMMVEGRGLRSAFHLGVWPEAGPLAA